MLFRSLCGTRGWFFEEEKGGHNEKMRAREALRLEASLKAGGDRPKLAFLHYPPLYEGYQCREILEVLEREKPALCCYGHLHGPSHRRALQGTRFGTEFKLVAADYPADNMAVVNFSATDISDGTSTYTAGAYCSRIAGILASTDLAASATFAPLPEVVSVGAVEDPDAAVNAGKLILLHDGRKAKLCRAVNSLTTVPAGGKESLRKIKVVEAVDLIRSYALRLGEDKYMGVRNNSYDKDRKSVV